MIVISKEFWIVNEASRATDELPPKFINALDWFHKFFIHTKASWELIMLPTYGVVKLKLTFDNGDFEFSANPIQTSIISLFHDEDRKLSIDEIEKQLKIP